MNYKNKRVTVFGLGKSGRAAAKKLASLGAKVAATDSRAELEKEVIEGLNNLDVEIELGGHTLKSIDGADLIIVSPGVHLDIPLLKEAKRRGMPVISEIELAYQFLKKPIIAVTGTNGKTTTATLIGEMLKAGGKKAVVAGNIGNPLVEVEDRSLDYVVAEISSYQLETIVDFRPLISVVLNIQPDHLERHRTMQEYIRQKSRIFINQKRGDYIIYNRDDPQVSKMVRRARAKRVGFSKKETGEILSLKPEEIKIPGRHNLENSLAAAQAVYLCGVSREVVACTLRTFPGVEHRIELVDVIKGVEFRNDSKATNPDSTLVALETFAGRGVILILGGREKGVDLSPLCSKIAKLVKAVVLIGESAQKFEDALTRAGYNAVYRAGFSMERAVKQAYRLASAGDIILLSPACASFDMFPNFEERGRIFKDLCRKLKK